MTKKGKLVRKHFEANHRDVQHNLKYFDPTTGDCHFLNGVIDVLSDAVLHPVVNYIWMNTKWPKGQPVDEIIGTLDKKIDIIYADFRDAKLITLSMREAITWPLGQYIMPRIMDKMLAQGRILDLSNLFST